MEASRRSFFGKITGLLTCPSLLTLPTTRVIFHSVSGDLATTKVLPGEYWVSKEAFLKYEGLLDQINQGSSWSMSPYPAPITKDW